MLQELFSGCLQLDTSEQTAVFFDQLRQLPACKGIVLFADCADKPVKLQITADIRRTARDKLITESEDTLPKADLAQVASKIYYTCCHNDFRAMLYHYLVARTIYPDRYRNLIALPKQTYAAVDMTFQWPYFYTSSSPLPGNGILKFGLFPSRRAASQLVELLNDVFCLCRRPDLIRSNDQQTCPYLQMQTCPAPCMGKIPPEQYSQAVEMAVGAASGRAEASLEYLRSQMLENARMMQFELADELKKKLHKLESLRRPDYRWLCSIPELAVLHIDRSERIKPENSRKKVQTYSAFLIKADRTVEFEDFQRADAATAIAELPAQRAASQSLEDDQQIRDRLSLLAYFLFRTTASGLWLDISREAPPLEEIKRLMAEYLQKEQPLT